MTDAPTTTEPATGSSDPPGPPTSLLTVLRQVANILLGRGEPLTEQHRTAAEYGDVAAIRAPGHTYLVSHPDLVHQVLATDGKITRKGRGLQHARLLLGGGLVTAEADDHLRSRRLVAPAFAKDHVTGYAEVMLRAVAEQDGQWRERLAGGDPDVEMSAEMSRLTLRIAGLTLFGADLEERSAEIEPAVAEAFRMLNLSQLPGAGFFLRGPTPWARRLRAARGVIHHVAAQIIAEHRTDPDRFRGDVLSVLLTARDDDGTAMSDEQILDEVTTLLLAGHETTANLLTWTWYLLDQNRTAAALLHQEVDALGRAPLPSDAAPSTLPYTRAVLAESMRLFPPAWVLPRQYAGATTIGGFRVPVNKEVLTSQWVVHRDPRWWGRDAGAFRPARWLSHGRFDHKAPGHPRYAYFPFGGGKRVCVGEQFAWTEGVLVLASLARHWQPRLDADQAVELEPLITLRPRHGMRMTLEPRGSAGEWPASADANKA